MTKKFIYLSIALLSLLLVLVIILWLVFTNMPKEATSKSDVVSQPFYTQVSAPLSYILQSDLATFMKDSELRYDGIKITQINNANINGLDIKFETSHGNIYFIKADSYKNDIEVYERGFLSQTQSGTFIKRGEFTYKNTKFSTSLMRLATGGFTYQVITGFKKGDKGYYVSIVIPRNTQDLTSTEIEDVLKFELNSEYKTYMDLLLALSNLNLSSNIFNLPILDNNLVNQFRNTSKQFGGGEFPSTF
jgi:hypothetical protein